ncbi:MAG TPA: hypothetical protein PLY87_16690 [Planctomycetaceae bacterium]|nr:hypothetical protein [Planctomycetaceae bacterium]HQZ66733.1 hypothetical protein [Planctomycetaceae bacterium]
MTLSEIKTAIEFAQRSEEISNELAAALKALVSKLKSMEKDVAELKRKS